MVSKMSQSVRPMGRMTAVIGRLYLNALNSRLGHLDIERNYLSLLLIDEADGIITQQELANLLEIDKVSVLRIIQYLTEHSYVHRMKVPADGRKYGLVLTVKARNALPGIRQAFREINRVALRGLNAKQVREFYATLEIIKNNLNKHNKKV